MTTLPRLQVQGHYLATGPEQPFFWMGDTAWEMVHKATRDEIETYFAKRSAQGFNLSQTVIIGELDGLMAPNPDGITPLMDNDPARPNESFLQTVDFIIETAAKNGMYIGLLPTWGEWVTPRFHDFRVFAEPAQSYVYGNILGKRYASATNLVWILGGDRLPDEAENGVEVWRAMAAGIADGVHGISRDEWQMDVDYSKTLMSYHCMAHSSKWFNDDPWIDFHSFGSYHEKRYVTLAYTQVAYEWSQPNPKPILNMEPCYEKMTLNYTKDASGGIFSALDARVAAYWSVFAGAFGHTYGHNAL